MAVCNFVPLFPSPCPNFLTNIAEIGKTKLFSCIAGKTTCAKWRIDKNLIATTNLSIQREYQNGHSFMDEFDIVHKRKLENIKQLLLESKEEDPIESLILINAIQRLAIDHHFQEEIETILREHYVATSISVFGFYSLRDVSLLFRLLRQEGYPVPADVFHNFKGKDGKFKGHLRRDVRGLMELCERLPEDILDVAAKYTSQILSERLPELDSEIVSHTLMYPYHKSVARLTANCHLKKSFEGINKWYIWSIAAMTDPSLSEQRIDLTKSIAFIYYIDDIFDLYGKPDELTLFTEAINRWEHAAIENLPEYMKICCKALINTTNEIGYKIYRKRGQVCVMRFW